MPSSRHTLGRNKCHFYFPHSRHFSSHFHIMLEVPCPLLCFHQMFVVWFAPFFSNFRSVFCTLKVCRVFKEPVIGKKKLLIAMFYYICLLKSSRIYYCANAAIMLRRCIKMHLTQGLKEISDIFITAELSMEIWNALWIWAPVSDKNIYTLHKTYATEITTKCVHLVSFIIADSL